MCDVWAKTRRMRTACHVVGQHVVNKRTCMVMSLQSHGKCIVLAGNFVAIVSDKLTHGNIKCRNKLSVNALVKKECGSSMDNAVQSFAYKLHTKFCTVMQVKPLGISYINKYICLCLIFFTKAVTAKSNSSCPRFVWILNHSHKVGEGRHLIHIPPLLPLNANFRQQKQRRLANNGYQLSKLWLRRTFSLHILPSRTENPGKFPFSKCA